MYSLLKFFAFYLHVILFFVFEAVSLYMVITYNQSQKESFSDFQTQLGGYLSAKSSNVVGFFSLHNEIEKVHRENAKLRETLSNNAVENRALAGDSLSYFGRDSSSIKYRIIPARVVSNSVGRGINYIVLNVGEEEGLRVGMGVVGYQGVVGVVSDVTKHFAQVHSLLSTKSNISAKLELSEAFGSLVWDGADARYALLTDVPKYIAVQKGEKIFTSGYSLIFPEGIALGEVDEVIETSGLNEYEVKVKLAENMIKVKNVFVIDFVDRPYFKYE